MSLITNELIIILLILMAACVLFNLVKTRKIKNEPLLSEEAVVHSKSPNSNRFDSLFTMEFLITARDTVVTCKVPYDVWNMLEVGYQGTLNHKGGFLHSFVRNGETYSATYNSGIPV